MSEKALRVETLHSDDEHSCALVALRGLNRKTINRRSTMLYHVIAGEGVMHVGGEEYELEPGVIIEVPPRTPYYDEGMVDMEVCSVPPFSIADVDVIDQLYFSDPMQWIRREIGSESGRDGSEVTNHELFVRYNDGGRTEWYPRAAKAVYDFFSGIGATNIEPPAQ